MVRIRAPDFSFFLILSNMFFLAVPKYSYSTNVSGPNSQNALDLVQSVSHQCDISSITHAQSIAKQFFGVILSRNDFDNQLDIYNVRYSARVRPKGSSFIGVVDYLLHNNSYYKEFPSRVNEAELYYRFPYASDGFREFLTNLNHLFKAGSPVPSTPPQPTHEICHLPGASIRLEVRSVGQDSIASLTFYQNMFNLAKP